MSSKELSLKLLRGLARYRCPLNAVVLDYNESASMLNPWKIQLFPQWVTDRYNQCINLVLSKSNKLFRNKVSARSLQFQAVSKDEQHAFLDKWHIQGFGQGDAFGLYKSGVLLSIFVVKSAPKNTVNAGLLELNRYATASDIFVVGGFEKLFSHIQALYQTNGWVSYADLMVSQGALYNHTGWTLVGNVPVDYHYVYKGSLYHKFNFRISRFKSDPNLLYKEGYSERALAELNNIPRIYDCGKLKFIKSVPH